MKRAETVPSYVRDVLHGTDRTLGSMIEAVLGTAPSLEVVAQWQPDVPLPAWVAPPFASDAEVWARCTGYRLGESALSQNLAYVDLGAVDPHVTEGLQSGRVHLGQLFLDPRIDKHDYSFGEDEDAPQLMAEYHRHLGGDAGLVPCIWRRYVAGIDGRDCFVVIESLPLAAWTSLIGGDGHLSNARRRDV